MNNAQKTVKPPQVAQAQAEGVLLCPQCGKVVKRQSGHHKRFCSDQCRMAYWNSHPERVSRRAFYDLVCHYCGRMFRSYGNAHRKFCSRSCYDRYRKRGKQYDDQI